MNPKFVKSNAKLHPVPVRAQVWHKVGLDLIGPLPLTKKGNKYIVTLVDYFSKWPEATALPDKTATKGHEFVNAVQAEVYKLTDTGHYVSSAYHPQTNGLTERFNQTLQTALVRLVNNTQND
eukprot:Em0018g270a